MRGLITPRRCSQEINQLLLQDGYMPDTARGVGRYAGYEASSLGFIPEGSDVSGGNVLPNYGQAGGHYYRPVPYVHASGVSGHGSFDSAVQQHSRVAQEFFNESEALARMGRASCNAAKHQLLEELDVLVDMEQKRANRRIENSFARSVSNSVHTSSRMGSYSHEGGVSQGGGIAQRWGREHVGRRSFEGPFYKTGAGEHSVGLPPLSSVASLGEIEGGALQRSGYPEGVVNKHAYAARECLSDGTASGVLQNFASGEHVYQGGELEYRYGGMRHVTSLPILRAGAQGLSNLNQGQKQSVRFDLMNTPVQSENCKDGNARLSRRILPSIGAKSVADHSPVRGEVKYNVRWVRMIDGKIEEPNAGAKVRVV